jgi:UDP:flavonoid glycosyltransferase YjiC (YdhE family)
MKRILFLPYHGTGHFNPSFSLAFILQRNGYDVYFAGAEFFKPQVAVQGFRFFPMRSVPFGLGFEQWLNTIEKKNNLYWAELKDRFTDRLYKLREEELRKIIGVVKPDVILLDSVQSTDFIVLYPLLKGTATKVCILHAMFPTDIKPGRPPVNSDLFPEDLAGYQHAVNSVKQQKTIKALRQKLRFLGMDDTFLIGRRLRKNNIPRQYRSQRLTLTAFTTASLPEFVLTPREFDFPDFEEEKTQHYIGFLTDSQRNDPLLPEYTHVKDAIYKRKDDRQEKLIYCSFGTIDADVKGTIEDFLHKLINVVRGRPYVLVVSTKAKLHPTTLSSKPENVYIFKSVPQLEVLGRTDLFITHGGFGSIKESILTEVPMLMYPVHGDYDPRGNAARVVYHGFGLRGDAVNDTEDEIRGKIEELLTNPSYRQSIRTLKQINARYTVEKFLALFSNLFS